MEFRFYFISKRNISRGFSETSYLSYPNILLLVTDTCYLFPPRIFTHTVLAMELIAVISILFGVYIFIRAISKGREGAKSFLAGSIFLIFAMINDILHTNLIIYTGFYTPTGLFIFIFSQAFLLSARFAKAFTQVEDLSENLERKVIERTEQLNQANKTIEVALQKSDKLLLNILPEEVAEELKEKGLVTPAFSKAQVLCLLTSKVSHK